MKEYWSTITIKFGGNNLECESEEEYKKQIKEQYHDEYGINLTDDEIKVEE
jgi:hypothetical protein